MKGRKSKEKKLTRSNDDHPSDYVTYLTQFQDAGQNLVKKSKVLCGSTDLTFHCKDGSVRAHQMILGNHSKFLKRMFLEQHSFEFSLIDFENGVAQMTGRRASDQPMDIMLPDFTKDDLKRLLNCFYSGEILIEDEVQSLALRNLWKTLCIDSIKLSDLEFIEVEVHKKSKMTSNFNNSNSQRGISITPPPSNNHNAQNNCELQQQMSVPKKSLPASRQAHQPPPLGVQIQKPTMPQKRSISPLPKAVSIRSSPAKEAVNKFYQNFSCPKCHANITFHGRDVNGNLMKFQMHMISHFQDNLFSDVPFLPVYICPHNGPRCKENMKNRISFLCHLSKDHGEFFPRMQRIMGNNMGLKHADIEFFNHVIDTIKTYPTLKIDLGKCPSQYDLTDELEIYKAAELHSLEKNNTSGPYQCQTCGIKCANQDYAILHQFLEHGITFYGQPRVMKDVGVYLSCQDCNFTTFSKSLYLSHIGHGHGKFGEISTRLCSSVKGAPINVVQLFKKSTSQAQALQMDEVIFYKVNGVVTYECTKCPGRVKMVHFPTFVIHLQRSHKLPLIFKCKDCQRATVERNMNESYFKFHECHEIQQEEEPKPPVSTVTNSIPSPEIETIESPSPGIETIESDEDEQNSQREVVNKRTSLTPPPTSHKKMRTSYVYVDNSTTINELIEIE